MPKLLIVDDERDTTNILGQVAKEEGFDVDIYNSVDDCLKYMGTNYIGAYLDHFLGHGKFSTDIIKDLKNKNPLCQVIVFSGHFLDIAEADIVLLKPIKLEEVKEHIRKLKTEYLKHLEKQKDFSEEIVGIINSKIMYTVSSAVKRTAIWLFSLVSISLLIGFTCNVFFIGKISNMWNSQIIEQAKTKEENSKAHKEIKEELTTLNKEFSIHIGKVIP